MSSLVVVVALVQPRRPLAHLQPAIRLPDGVCLASWPLVKMRPRLPCRHSAETLDFVRSHRRDCPAHPRSHSCIEAIILQPHVEAALSFVSNCCSASPRSPFLVSQTWRLFPVSPPIPSGPSLQGSDRGLSCCPHGLRLMQAAVEIVEGCWSTRARCHRDLRTSSASSMLSCHARHARHGCRSAKAGPGRPAACSALPRYKHTSHPIFFEPSLLALHPLAALLQPLSHPSPSQPTPSWSRCAIK